MRKVKSCDTVIDGKVKDVLFYTHNDLDGIGCGILAKLAYGDKATIKYVGNFDIDKEAENLLTMDIQPSAKIFFTDICPSSHILGRLHTYFHNQIVVLDHHKSNLHACAILGENGIVKVDKNIEGVMDSGTSLTYQYLKGLGLYDNTPNPSLLQLFVDTVRSYDTYQWKEDNNDFPKKLQTLLSLLSDPCFIDKIYGRLNDPKSKKLIRDTELEFIDSRILQENEGIKRIIEDRHKNVKTVDVGPYKVGIMYYPGGISVSEMSHQFLMKHNDLDILAVINMYYGSINFRAVKMNVDCVTKFALPLGGGGHPRASGCPIPVDVLKSFISDIMGSMEEAYKK